MLIPRRWADTYPGEWDDIQAWAKGELRLAEDIVAQFENAVAEYTGAPQAAAISSGRAGMRIILKHLGIGPGDEVIVPAYTLAALLPLIQALEATPVAADVDLRTMNLTAATIERALSPRTRAILLLHAFGNPAPMDSILALAQDRGIHVVEDCAHALGATCAGQQVGTFGYAGFYSFEPTKPVNTYGGGMVVSSDPDLIAKVRAHNAAQAEQMEGFLSKAQAVEREQSLFRSGLAWPLLTCLALPGIRTPLEWLYRKRQGVPSGQASYSRLQAHLGLRKLATLTDRLKHRAHLVALYRSQLGPDLPLQRQEEQAISTWYFATVTLPGRAGRRRLALLARGVDTAVEAEVMDDCAALLGQDDCPVAADLFRRNLVLPLFDSMTESQVTRVARSVRSVLGRTKP
jgi:perosamine synthetase